jgi:hypothetical protein
VTLYEIFQHGSNLQGGSTERIARELAMEQMRREAQENARAERLMAAAQRRMQAAAVNDPALVQLRGELERPVQPFTSEEPGSYAPGTVDDLGTLRGAFSGRGEPTPYDETPRRFLDVALGGGQAMAPERVEGQPAHFDLPTLNVGGAFNEPELWDNEIGETVRAPARYETTVRGKRDEPKRKPLPAKPRRMEGGIELGKGQRLPTSEQRPELLPEGVEIYQRLVPSLVARRNSEETSRRMLEAEEMRQKGGERKAQLKSATDLLRQQMRMQMEAEKFRQKRLGAKGKDEALKWADQERDARLQVMNHAAGVVSKYKAAMTDDPNDPEYRAALQALDEATRAYNESERDFNALRTQKGMDPKGKKPAGKTQSYTLEQLLTD